MKTKWMSVVVTLAAVAMAFVLSACNKRGAGTKPADVDYYTCTMHPSVKSQNPKAKCPICSMELVPVKKKDVKAAERPSVEAPPHQTHAEHAQHAPRSDVPTPPEEQPGEFSVPKN